MGSQPPENCNCAIQTQPERVSSAWRAWLRALATDAEAALGAALAYDSLDASGRDAFLDALEQDAPNLGVPRVALFAPLLSVEVEPVRRERIQTLIGEDLGTVGIRRPEAMIGIGKGNDSIVVVTSPVYLDFVHVTTCRCAEKDGVAWVHDEPLVHLRDAPRPGDIVEDVALEPVPLSAVIDVVATAVVAHRRRGRTLPDSLKPLLYLFRLGESDET